MTSGYALENRVWEVWLGETGKKARIWDAQDIVFDVKKYADSTPNEMEISITNLSPDSRDYIKKGMAISLKAGYKAESGEIYSGKIDLPNELKGSGILVHDRDRKDDTDWITPLVCRDGAKEFRDTIFSESFESSVSKSAVIRRVIKALGIPTGVVKLLGVKGEFGNGIAFNEPAYLALNRLAKESNSKWFINDGVLYFLPITEAYNNTPILLDSESGLIGSPARTENGYEFTSFLRASLNPGQLVEVKARYVSGLYIVKYVHHRGDTKSSEWYTKFEGIKKNG